LCDTAAVTVGGDADVDNVHTTVIRPYIEQIIKNIDKRFGDAVGEVSVAAQLFSPEIAVQFKQAKQYEHLTALARYFKVDSEAACSEWTCFRNYIDKHKADGAAEIFKSLLTTDVGDSYPVLSKLAAVTLACPIGTAGIYHFTTYMLLL